MAPPEGSLDPPAEPPAGDGLGPAYSAIVDDDSAEPAMREMAMLLALAERHLEAEEAEEALQLATEALEGLRELGEATAVADALRLVLHCFRFQDKRAFASQTAQEEMELFKSKGDALGQAKMLLSLAELNADRRGQEHCKEALQWATWALAIFRDRQEPRLEAMTLLAMASTYLRNREGSCKQQAKLALEQASQAASLFAQAGDARGQARALHGLAAACAAARDTEGALKASREALALARELGDRRQEAFELQCMALWRLGGEAQETRRALPDAELALATFRDLEGSRRWEAGALSTVVQALVARGQAAQALYLAKEGLQRLRMSGDKAAEARALDAIIQAQVAIGDGQGALRAAERGRAAFRNLGDRHRESAMLRTVCGLQLSGWDTDRAREAAEEALRIGEQLQSNQEKGDAWLQLAEVRLANGEFMMAAKASEEAMSHYQKEGDLRLEAVSLLTTASAHFNFGDLEKAGSIAMQAHNCSKEAGDERGEARSLSMLCRVQTARGDYGRALVAADRARGILEELGDRPGEAEVLLLAAQASLRQTLEGHEDIAFYEDSKVAALAAAGEAVSLCREEEEVQDRDLLARSLFMLAQAEILDDRPDEALEDADEAMNIFRERGDARSEATVLHVMSQAYSQLGEAEEAWKAASDAHALYVGIGDAEGEATLTEHLQQLGSVHAGAPQGPEAEAPLAAAAGEPRKAPKALAKLDTSGGVDYFLVIQRMKACFEELAIDEEIEVDTGLMTAGVTSSLAVTLRNMLSSDFPSVNLPPTLVFDYPTMGDIAQYILHKLPSVSG